MGMMRVMRSGERVGRRLSRRRDGWLATHFVPVGAVGPRVNGAADEGFHAYPAGFAASAGPALARSTSNSTVTSSRSLSAPKKPLYGLIPKADWGTGAD